MRQVLVMLGVLLAMGAPLRAADEKPATGDAPASGDKPKADAHAPACALDFRMKDIDGKDTDLAQWKGKVVMLVNVASRCGNTPQYAQLQALYDKYKDSGLVVVGVPANNFGGQEPGSEAEIKQFCTGKYHVTFPMLAKVSVLGADICPLYSYLTGTSAKPGAVTWNFAKFLVGRDGQVVDRFDPRTKPDDAAVVGAVEKALAAKP
jgi:glutathione peroxidase